MAAIKTTRLKAVNIILSAAGKGPITNIVTGASMDSDTAQGCLDETINVVLSEGWYFNTRKNVTLSPDVNSEILLQENVIRLEFPYIFTDGVKYTIRGNKLYNANTGTTNEFDEAVVADIVELLEWDDLPEAARIYIAKSAARLFVDRFISDPNRIRSTAADEAMAYAKLKREDVNTSNSRIFGPEFSRIVDRGKPLDWVN